MTRIKSYQCNSPDGSLRERLEALGWQWEREGDGRITVWTEKGVYQGTYTQHDLRYLDHLVREVTEDSLTCDRCECTISSNERAKGWPVAVSLDPETIEYVCPDCYGGEAYCPHGHVLPADCDSDDCPDCNPTPLTVVIEYSGNEVQVDGRTYWCPPGGGYVRLVTHDSVGGALGTQVCDGLELRGSTLSCRNERLITTVLRELDAPRLVVLERSSAVGPRVRWWGEVTAEEIELQLDEDQMVDWSSAVTTESGGGSAPLVNRPDRADNSLDAMEARAHAALSNACEGQSDLLDPMSAIEVDHVAPSEVARGWDVDLTVGDEAVEVTLVPGPTGEPTSWGSVDNWVDGETVLRVREMDDDARLVLLGRIECAAAAAIRDSGIEPSRDPFDCDDE